MFYKCHNIGETIICDLSSLPFLKSLINVAYFNVKTETNESYTSEGLKFNSFQQSYLYQIIHLFIKYNPRILLWRLFRAGFLF